MILLCTVVSLVVLQCHSFAFRLIARRVDFWCRKPATFGNLSTAEWKQVGLPPRPDGTHSQCEVYDNPLSPRRLPVPCTSWDYEPGARSIITTWDLVCNMEWVVSFSAVTYMMGAAISVPTMGMVADRKGRRPVTCIAVAILLLAGFTTCITNSLTLFVCARCVVAASTSTIFVTLFILLFEVMPAKCRTLYGVIAVSPGVGIATVLFVVLGQFCLDWRVTQAIFMGLTSLLVITFYIVGESPCWLITCSNFKKAETAVLWAAKMNGEPLDVVRKRFAKLKNAILMTEECVSPRAVTPAFLLGKPMLRGRCCMLFFCWCIIMFSVYGLAQTQLRRELGWAKIVITVCPGPLSVLAYYAIKKLGSKITLVLALGAVGVASAGLMGSYPNSLLPFTNLLLLIARGSTFVAVSVNYIYTAEVFPTVLRSVGVCTSYFCGGLGAAAATFVMDPETGIPVSVGMAILACLVLLAELTLLKLPETSPQPLAKTLKQFEEMNYKKFLQDSENIRKASEAQTKQPGEVKDRL
ncbi:solute carrier family 22 member 7-like [Ornithodoros turicata]|uniref:solute carrier family 22 member 7-like n=1 Tax=Ornithodoros turicata TaxID=34597 RepID=UPI0031387CA4